MNKTIIWIILTILMSASVLAANTHITNKNITVDNLFINSLLGIGTTSPSAALDVVVSSGGAATIGSSTCSATGDYAIAMGYNALAQNIKSIAIGENVRASGSNSIAMGKYAKSLGASTFTWGGNNCTSNPDHCKETDSGMFTVFGGMCVSAKDEDCGKVSDGTIKAKRVCLGADCKDSWWSWILSGSDLYYDGGNVGIGTDAPTKDLDVNGTIKAKEVCLGADCKTSWPTLSISCPSGFLHVSGAGRILGCINSYEESTKENWFNASIYCLQNYGGRLPTCSEWYAAVSTMSLNNETDDYEICSDMLDIDPSGKMHGVIGYSNAENILKGSTDVKYVFRCFIPN